METQINNFNFELISPEEKLISAPAYQVIIPGDDGNVGVRAGHMNLLLSVRAGVLEVIKTKGGETEKIFIAGGFADISQKNTTVLVEQAVLLNSLNLTKLEDEAKKLSDDLLLALSDEQRAKVLKRLVLVNHMIDAVKEA